MNDDIYEIEIGHSHPVRSIFIREDALDIIQRALGEDWIHG